MPSGAGGSASATQPEECARASTDDPDVVIVDVTQSVDPARAYHALSASAADDVTCPVCSSTLHRAVLHVDCGASFCEGCVTQLAQRALQNRTPTCPLCRKAGRVFVPNLALRNVVATLEAHMPPIQRAWPEKARLDQIVQLARHLD
jgi:hypothetical protein